jgi:hypothetical protein
MLLNTGPVNYCDAELEVSPMNFILRELAIAAVALGASVCDAEEAKSVSGVDLFVDLKDHVGKEALLTDGVVFAADSRSISIKAGPDGAVSFHANTDDIDRESLRFFLSNCTAFRPEQRCRVPLLVTPTGEKTLIGGSPELKNVKMVASTGQPNGLAPSR